MNRQETCNGLVFWCVWKRGEPQIANFEITLFYLFWDLLKSSQIGVRNQAMDTAGEKWRTMRTWPPRIHQFLCGCAPKFINSGGSIILDTVHIPTATAKDVGDWGEYYSDDFGLRPCLGVLLVLDRKAGMENFRDMATTRMCVAFCECLGMWRWGTPNISPIDNQNLIWSPSRWPGWRGLEVFHGIPHVAVWWCSGVTFEAPGIALKSGRSHGSSCRKRKAFQEIPDFTVVIKYLRIGCSFTYIIIYDHTSSYIII